VKLFIAGLATGAILTFSGIAYLESTYPNIRGADGNIFLFASNLYKAKRTAPEPREDMKDAVTAKVLRVVDGDTVDIEVNGERQRVRYIGINTPERNEPCYEQATQANIDLVLGKTVRLVKDKSDTDRYGRLLRYLFVDDIFVNKVLVEQGHAEAVLYKPDDQYYNQFSYLEEVAAEAGLGCHMFNIFDDGNTKR
jgi:endonuclease YncB( thermonuclease family)